MHYTRLLSIAGSDSGGGAGIQADLKTFSALGGFGMSAITALTAQNTQGVDGIHPIPPDFVAQQIHAVVTDIGVDAVKLGMLANTEIIRVVAACVQTYAIQNLVLDPVMVSTSGAHLLEDHAVAALRDELLPLALIITPNTTEAAILLGRTIATENEMAPAARDLLALGCRAVLVKGGHFDGSSSDDVLALQTEAGPELIRIPGRRVATRNTHGTGCALSSAIAAYLGHGVPLLDAVHRAKAYIQQAIEASAAYTIGHGHGPVHHFHALWPKHT